MKAIIKLDVPEWQIGQPVHIFFKDTMEKHSVCEEDIVRCKDCKFKDDRLHCFPAHKGHYMGDDWYCADGGRRVEGNRNGNEQR